VIVTAIYTPHQLVGYTKRSRFALCVESPNWKVIIPLNYDLLAIKYYDLFAKTTNCPTMEGI
jgi:hypothetical protein